MVEERNHRVSKYNDDVSVPSQVWNKYRYLTVYAAIVSTLLLILQLLGR